MARKRSGTSHTQKSHVKGHNLGSGTFVEDFFDNSGSQAKIKDKLSGMNNNTSGPFLSDFEQKFAGGALIESNIPEHY